MEENVSQTIKQEIDSKCPHEEIIHFQLGHYIKVEEGNSFGEGIGGVGEPQVVLPNTEADYICYHCHVHYSELSSLKAHIEVSHLEKPIIKREHLRQYCCPNCSYVTSNFSNLESHMLAEIQQRCPECNYLSKNENDLLKHKCSARNPRVIFECPLFDLTSLPITDFPSGTDSSLHVCKYCNFKSAQLLELHKHIRKEHSKERPHLCPHCPLSYSHASSLRLHITCHHEKKRAWVCPYCGTALTRSHTLRDHIQAVHLGERPYLCPHCPYSAPVSSYLKAHIKGKHRSERPYKCSFCPYSSSRSNTLDSHIRTQHTNDRPHKCSQCNFSCLRPCFLRQHILSKHSEERPYVCPYCTYATVRSSNLKSHMKVHLKDAKSAINVCSDAKKVQSKSSGTE